MSQKGDAGDVMYLSKDLHWLLDSQHYRCSQSKSGHQLLCGCSLGRAGTVAHCAGMCQVDMLKKISYFTDFLMPELAVLYRL